MCYPTIVNTFTTSFPIRSTPPHTAGLFFFLVMFPILAVCCVVGTVRTESWGSFSVSSSPVDMAGMGDALYLGRGVVVEEAEVPFPFPATTAASNDTSPLAVVADLEETVFCMAVATLPDRPSGSRILATATHSDTAITLYNISDGASTVLAAFTPNSTLQVVSLTAYTNTLLVASCTYRTDEARCIGDTTVTVHSLVSGSDSIMDSVVLKGFAVNEREAAVSRDGVHCFGGVRGDGDGSAACFDLGTDEVEYLAVGGATVRVAFSGDTLLCASVQGGGGVISTYSMQDSMQGVQFSGPTSIALDVCKVIHAIRVVRSHLYITAGTQGLLRIPLDSLVQDSLESVALPPPVVPMEADVRQVVVVPVVDVFYYHVEEGGPRVGAFRIACDDVMADPQGWLGSHGTPSLSDTTIDLWWLWSYGGIGEGIYAPVPFVSGGEYTAMMTVQTDLWPDGTIALGDFFVVLTNGLTPTTDSYGMPHPKEQQRVYSSALVFPNYTDISFSFTARANFAQLWVYPFWADMDHHHQADMRVKGVRVCRDDVPEPTATSTAAPTTAPTTVPTAAPTATSTTVPLPEFISAQSSCNLVVNSLFHVPEGWDEAKHPPGAFTLGQVTGWHTTSKTPSVFGGLYGPDSRSAWMWSHSGSYEGVGTNIVFTVGVRYQVTVRLLTRVNLGHFVVTVRGKDGVSSVVFTGENSMFPDWGTLSFSFVAGQNYTELCFNPFWKDYDQELQAELRLAYVGVCAVAPIVATSEAPHTLPPHTLPPHTEPPLTEPPQTLPPTEPLHTDPPQQTDPPTLEPTDTPSTAPTQIPASEDPTQETRSAASLATLPPPTHTPTPVVSTGQPALALATLAPNTTAPPVHIATPEPVWDNWSSAQSWSYNVHVAVGVSMVFAMCTCLAMSRCRSVGAKAVLPGEEVDSTVDETELGLLEPEPDVSWGSTVE